MTGHVDLQPRRTVTAFAALIRWRTASAPALLSIVGAATGAIPGFALPYIVASSVSNRASTDAFFLSVGLATFAALLLAGALETVFLGYVASIRATNPAQLWSGITGIHRRAFAVGLLLGASIVPLYVVAYDAALAAVLVLMPFPALVVGNAVLAATNFAFGSFILPNATQSFRALGGLTGLAIAPDHFLIATALGVVVGEFVRMLALYRLALRHVRRTPRADAGELPMFAWRSVAVQAVSGGIIGLSPIVDNLVAVRFGVGAITSITLAERLFYVPLVLLALGAGPVLARRWADLLHRGGIEPFSMSVFRVLRIVIITFTALGLLGAIFVTSDPLRRLADSYGVPLTPLLAAIYFPALGVALANSLGVRALQLAGAPRWLLVSALLGLATTVVGDLVGAYYIGLKGIAVSSSLVRLFTCAVVMYGLRQAVLSARQDAYKAAARRVEP